METIVAGPKGTIKMFPQKVKLNYLEEKPEKYRLHWMRSGDITDEDIIAYAAQAAHVPEACLVLAQDALYDAIDFFCRQGHAVQIPNLGTFSVKLNSKVVATPKEANAESVTHRRLRFYPKKRLKAACSLKNIRINIEDVLGLKKKDVSRKNSGNEE